MEKRKGKERDKGGRGTDKKLFSVVYRLLIFLTLPS